MSSYVCVVCTLALASLSAGASEYSEHSEDATFCQGERVDSAAVTDEQCNANLKRDTQKYNNYKKSPITSRYDFAIKELLDEADMLISQGRFDKARQAYTSILQDHPLSPRAHFGRATALENLWQKSGTIAQLEEAVDEFDKVVNFADTPNLLFVAATQRLVVGTYDHLNRKDRAVDAQLRLVERFPNKLEFKNGLALSYFEMSKLIDKQKLEHARTLFMEVLAAEPNNGFALAYYGFILVYHDENLDKGVELLTRGLRSRADGTKHELFYQHLGKALIKLGRRDEASELFQEAAERGLVRSALQRSTHNVDGLSAHPRWTIEEFGYGSSLDAIGKDWRVIRDEAIQLLHEHNIRPTREHENLLTGGDWKSFNLYKHGVRVDKHCERMPRTCEIVERAPDATSCTRGQIKVSALEPGTVVLPHTGPTNCRIRAHLGLYIPPGAHLRVAGEERTLREGEWIVFDDSFEHEVWHDGDETRIILIVDFWHPDLTPEQRSKLEPIDTVLNQWYLV